jgi:hypothetical protein
LKETFLDYLLTWEKEVFELKGCTPTQKDSMLLSKETRAGLKMTVITFTEMGPALCSLPGQKFMLSERFNQDSLESYFGKQRSKGHYNDNPSVQQYLQNTNILRVVDQLSLDPIRSNIRGRKRTQTQDDACIPLPKRTSHNTVKHGTP